MTTLNGVDQIQIKSDSRLIFSHPAVPQGPLYVHSGASAIKWAYTLNTVSTPTIGGEVVQVLSALVGPMQISGQTAGLKVNKSGKHDANEIKGWKKFGGNDNYSPNDELREIAEWFIAYMEVAGSTTRGNQRRDERAVHFLYPARGWDFYIIPTGLSGFRYDREVIAPEWSITAEIISDNALNFFQGVTMSSFSDDLITNQSLLGTLGLSAFANSGTEVNNPAFGQTGDAGSTDPFLNPQLATSATDLARKMGNNFQALVAAWSGGTFADFGFGALLDNGALPKNVDDVYTSLFGSSFLSLPGTKGGGLAGGSVGGTSDGGPSQGTTTYTGTGSAQSSFAALIANAFANAGIPPELGLAIAIHESNLNPDTNILDTNGARSIGMFQGNLIGALAGNAKAIAAGQHPNDPASDYYPANAQIADAVQWIGAARPASFTAGMALNNNQLAQWAFAAQRGSNYTTDNTTTGNCTSLFAGQLAQARNILKSLDNTTTSGATPSASSGTANQFYKNPYRDIQGLTSFGVDQGVDYGGTGGVYALGRARITFVSTNSGWPGGGAISYTLLDGPAAGKGVYLAENITPQVGIGDVVDSDTVIATMHNAYPYTESGWCLPGTDQPLSPLMENVGQNHAPKAYGVNFNQLLIALGCPSAGSMPATTVDPPVPSNWPTWS